MFQEGIYLYVNYCLNIFKLQICGYVRETVRRRGHHQHLLREGCNFLGDRDKNWNNVIVQDNEDKDNVYALRWEVYMKQKGQLIN